MKKLVFVMPLMAISLLASCGCSKSESTYTITFKNDGDEDKKIENIKAGSIITENIPTPITPKPDSTFIGWCTDTESKYPFDFSKIKIYQDYTLYSGWETATYTVTFDAGDGKFINGKQEISFGLKSGTKLLPYIRQIQPTSESQTFAYYEYEEKDNAIDYDDVITEDITLKANYFEITAPLTDLDSPKNISWKEIKAVATTNCNPSSCFKIGATKKVQLKHQDSEGDGTDKITEGELYQTVRIIGFNGDYTELPEPGEDPDPNKSIGITFEFADLISDEKGLSLAAYWNDTTNTDAPNHNYKDSTIRKALNGDTNDINWFRYYGEEEDTEGTGLNRHFAKEDNYKKSILNMLPDELTKEGILKTTSKYININNGDGWKEETVDDKLFLLSPFEMGKAPRGYEEAHTTTYSYYKGADINRRIKHQINWHDGARTSSLKGKDLDGQSGSNKYSYAGYNSDTENYYGGNFWLRSPYTYYDASAWYVPGGGDPGLQNVLNCAYAVTPAFCI